MEKYRKIFIKNLNTYLRQHEMSQVDLANLLQINKSVVSSWLSGSRYPRMNTMEKIANVFHIEKSDLIEDKTTPNDAHASLPELSQKDEREIESDLEDMMNSISSTAYDGDDGIEDMEAFKATIKAAMIQAKRIAKKKYTPKKYRKDK